LVPVLGGAQSLEDPQVPVVHREQQIEIREVFLRHLPRSQARNVVAAFFRMRDRAAVGRFPDVIVMRSGGIDLNVQVFSFYQFLQYAFPRRGTANVPCANHQELHSGASSTPKTRLRSSASWSRALAAFSNSRFFAKSSICFSSALISRASCFSLIDS